MEFDGGNEKGKTRFEKWGLNGEREGNGLDAIDGPLKSSETERDST